MSFCNKELLFALVASKIHRYILKEKEEKEQKEGEREEKKRKEKIKEIESIVPSSVTRELLTLISANLWK